MSNIKFTSQTQSIGSEVLRRSFRSSILISIVLFVGLSFLLCANQVVQKRQAIEQKLNIDSEFIVNAVKIGDLFFITKYLAAFVDSGVVEINGLKQQGEDSWLGISPPGTSPQLLEQGQTAPGILSTTVYGTKQLQDQNGSVWNFYFSYSIPHFFLVYAALISFGLSIIIFFFLNGILKETASHFSEPVENINKDLDVQIASPMSAFKPKYYSEGQQFLETDRFVFELDRLLTETKLQQEKIKEAEVHEALSRLGRQVNHDIQSPLGALRAAIEQIDKNRSASLGLMKRSAQRIQDIVADLKLEENRVGQTDVHFKDTEINSFLYEIISEKRAEYNEGVEFLFEQNPEAIFLPVERVGLARAISNIINNGIEAVREEDPVIAVKVLVDSGQVKISISDNGPGVPQEVRGSIFDYGFSSGKLGGSGTGLSQAASVVERHNGIIEVVEGSAGHYNKIVLSLKT